MLDQLYSKHSVNEARVTEWTQLNLVLVDKYFYGFFLICAIHSLTIYILKQNLTRS